MTDVGLKGPGVRFKRLALNQNNIHHHPQIHKRAALSRLQMMPRRQVLIGNPRCPSLVLRLRAFLEAIQELSSYSVWGRLCKLVPTARRLIIKRHVEFYNCG